MPLLVVRHAAWEGPHRILDAFAGAPVQVVEPLAGQALPDHRAVRGAVFMGGPISVNDTDTHPALADEVAWLARAVPAGLPVLGVCLGSQLLARALGSVVAPGAAKEIGWGPVEILDADDPVVGPLAPTRVVLRVARRSVPAGPLPADRSAGVPGAERVGAALPRRG